MTFKRYLTTTYISMILSWSAWLMVMYKLNPYESRGLSLGPFFLSLFFALTSTLTILGFHLRKWLYKNEIFYHHINISLRQAVLLTLCILASLVFLMLGVLTWWNGLLLVAIIILVEFYFVSKDPF